MNLPFNKNSLNKSFEDNQQVLLPFIAGVVVGVLLAVIFSGENGGKISSRSAAPFKADDDSLFDMDNETAPWAVSSSSKSDLDEYNIQPS